MERIREDAAHENIMRSFAQGNQACIGELYDKYAPALFGVISRIVGNHDLACDCLQHSFNEIWNQKSSYNSKKERLFTWMMKITRNSALNFLKNGHGSFIPESNPTDSREAFMDGKNEPAVTVNNPPEASVSAPGMQDEVLHLVYIKGFTIAEAASRLNISIETAKRSYISAIKQLKVKVAV